jgi:hypothetical protein
MSAPVVGVIWNENGVPTLAVLGVTVTWTGGREATVTAVELVNSSPSCLPVAVIV